MGQSGIESYVEHEEEAEIQQLLFLINEVSGCWCTSRTDGCVEILSARSGCFD